MEDSSNGQIPSKNLIDKYDGKQVVVFLDNGTRMTGVAKFYPNWVNIRNKLEKSAMCNYEHIVSIVLN